jgi:hypothetical protein
MDQADEEDFNELFTKVIRAPQSLIDKVEVILREELHSYKKVLSLYIDQPDRSGKLPISFGFNGKARLRDFLELFLNFGYYDQEESKEKRLFIFDKDEVIANAQKEDLIALFKADDIEIWVCEKERQRVRIGFNIGIVGYFFNHMQEKGLITNWRMPIITAKIFSVQEDLKPTKDTTLYSSLSKLNAILKKDKSDPARIRKENYVIKPLINAVTKMVDNHASK